MSCVLYNDGQSYVLCNVFYFIAAFLSHFLIITIPHFIRQILWENCWIPDKKYFVHPCLGSCLPGQLSPGQLSAWAVVAWAVVLAPTPHTYSQMLSLGSPTKNLQTAEELIGSEGVMEGICVGIA